MRLLSLRAMDVSQVTLKRQKDYTSKQPPGSSPNRVAQWMRNGWRSHTVPTPIGSSIVGYAICFYSAP